MLPLFCVDRAAQSRIKTSQHLYMVLRGNGSTRTHAGFAETFRAANLKFDVVMSES